MSGLLHAALSRWAFGLALGATGTAICLTVLAGWQRGGWLLERLVWVAIGVVLVLSTHLLPALSRSAPIFVRFAAGVLWAACLAAACYGHTTFFLLAQRHAGEGRVASVGEVIADAGPAGRSLTAIMTERAAVTRQLAAADARRCTRDCSALRANRVTLAAKLDAINVEADEGRRQQVAQDRHAERRETLLGDPLTTRLATALGTTATRVDLLSGLAFAAILEGVACLLWTLALQSRPHVAMTPAVIAPVTASHEAAASGHEVVTMSHHPVTGRHAQVGDPAPPAPSRDERESEVAQLVRDITAGHVRATVSDIRRHLGCSQARAAALRRQLSDLVISP